jgi:hypothetical protein
VTDELVKLVPLEVLVPEQFDVSYPGNDAWMQLDPNASAPSGDPAWLQIEKYLVSGGGTPKTVTALLQAQIDTAQFKFGSSSALFDGVGDYLSSPDHSDFVVGSGDFTAECWVRFSDITKTAAPMGQWDASASQMSWLILWNGSNQLSLASSVNGSTNVAFNWTWAPSNGVWYHVALVRSGTSVLIYVNGVALGAAQTLSGSLFNSTAPLTIGGRSDVTTNTIAGWVDEARLSVGIARYTAGFTAPSAPFTTDAYTKLLLHMEGADASTTFVDDSPLPPTGVDPGSDPAWMEVEH